MKLVLLLSLIATAPAQTAYGESLLDELDGNTDDTVLIYATLTDWRAGMPTDRRQAELVRSGHPLKLHFTGGLEPFQTLNLSYADARDLGPVFAIEKGGKTYINPSTPRANRWARFGAVEVVGRYAVYQTETCDLTADDPDWPELFSSCESDVAVMDLRNGDTQQVGRLKLRRWLKQAPELHAAWRRELIRNDAAIHRYLLMLLETGPRVALD